MFKLHLKFFSHGGTHEFPNQTRVLFQTVLKNKVDSLIKKHTFNIKLKEQTTVIGQVKCMKETEKEECEMKDQAKGEKGYRHNLRFFKCGRLIYWSSGLSLSSGHCKQHPQSVSNTTSYALLTSTTLGVSFIHYISK